MALGYAGFLTLHIDSHSPVAHLKPHSSSLLEAGLNPEIPDFSSHYCFTRSCSAAVTQEVWPAGFQCRLSWERWGHRDRGNKSWLNKKKIYQARKNYENI